MLRMHSQKEHKCRIASNFISTAPLTLVNVEQNLLATCNDEHIEMNEMSGKFLELIQLKQVYVSHKSCIIFENELLSRVNWPISEVGFQWFFQIQNGSFTNRTQNLTLSPGAQSIFCYL